MRALFNGETEPEVNRQTLKTEKPARIKEVDQAPKSGFKTSGFKSSFKPIANTVEDDADLDGEVMDDDVDGEAMDEDLDGEAMDEDLDGEMIS